MYICRGELAEWSNAAVLKTVVPQGTGGSNPSFSAKMEPCLCRAFFIAAFFCFVMPDHEIPAYLCLSNSPYMSNFIMILCIIQLTFSV